MNISIEEVGLPFLLPKTKSHASMKPFCKHGKEAVRSCWEKRDVIDESSHSFGLVKTGFIQNLNF